MQPPVQRHPVERTAVARDGGADVTRLACETTEVNDRVCGDA